ncbi:MAG: porphobilinogen synthase, partial [Firmicutes bacterium]|nr:porphobilinogen synthase [Bacillota bacterium]
MKLTQRPRRLRRSPQIRAMARETYIKPQKLIYPLFIAEGENIKEEIEAMPGQYRFSVDRLDEILAELVGLKVGGVLLFGIPGHKDECGSSAWDENGAVQTAVRYIKQNFPQLVVITDVCMCEYTSHGHCGILENNDVHNDKTLEVLAKAALSHAKAGADMVAPSDMMDGRVGCIREELDKNGFENTLIMAYSAKYASAFYGPFREAAGSAPSFGDRASYQMDPANGDEALREIALDMDEGADILMVKPALAYLDVLYRAKETSDRPVAAYSVSGEYSMIKAAAEKGFIDEKRIIKESALCIFRAGADMLITYFALELAKFIQDGE